MAIGAITDQARKKNALPFPNQPYAGSAPSALNYSSPTPATPAPSTVQDALRSTSGTVDQAKAALSSTQPFLDRYIKPNAAGTTDFRQALTNTKATETANAYDNAVAKVRSRAEASGFATRGQPVTFGAEAGLENERAKAIADLPNKVNIEAQPVEFQAAQMQQNQSGLYNALAGTQQNEAQILAQQKAASDAQKMGLASGLASAGISTLPAILKSVGKTAAGAGAGVAAGAGAGAAAPAVAGGLLNSGVAASGGLAAPVAPASTGLLGLGAAGIPIVGGAIAGGLLLANHFIGQGRKAADKLTGEGGIQHAFEDVLNQIDSAPGFSDAQKWQSKVQAYEKLKELGLQFAQKGDNERKVATQMFDEISHLFGDSNPLRGAA